MKSSRYVTVYANYGILSHEKEVVWSVSPSSADYAVDCEVVICRLPEGYAASENYLNDEIIIEESSNHSILLYESLSRVTRSDEDPYLIFSCEGSCYGVPLDVIERTPITPIYY